MAEVLQVHFFQFMSYVIIEPWPETLKISSRKHTYIILTPLNPTFI